MTSVYSTTVYTTSMKNRKQLLLLIAFLPLFAFPQGYLHTNGKDIVNGQGENVILRGIGTGNWMLMEGYMMKTEGEYNLGTQHEIRAKLIEEMGTANTDSFFDTWHENHFTRTDVDSMKTWGFNSVRVALHYKLFTLPIEDEPVSGENTWLEKGFAMTDSLLTWCAENEMYLILDLHGAPGGQGANADICDYDPSKPSLWESQENKNKTVALWQKLAERYSNEPWIGGYDLINETNWDLPPNNQPLRDLFEDITEAIREVDTNHIIFIEGNSFANDFNGLTPPWDDNMVYSFHKYWSGTGPSDLDWILELRDQYDVPLWMGESGENGNAWFTDLIDLCESNNIGWSWWPVKKNGLNNVLAVELPGSYDTLVKVWKGELNLTLSEDQVFNAVMDWTESQKIENCEVKYDVIDAMIRQPHSDETLPYTENKLTEPIFFSDYDLGRHGFAYEDKDIAYYGGEWTAWNNGWSYRSDGVDIEECADEAGTTNGYNVGWTEDDEWMMYTLEADSTAAYTLEVHSASGHTSGSDFYLEANGVRVSDVLSLPATGGWQNWESTEFQDIIIPEGEIKLRFYIEKEGSNLSYFNLKGPKETDEIEFRFMSAKTSLSGSSIFIDVNKAITTESANILPEDFEFTVNDSEVSIITAGVSSESGYVLELTHDEELFSDDILAISCNGTAIESESQPLSAFSDMTVANNLEVVYHVISGKIEAEDFYINNGLALESCSEGGQNTGYANAGDYLEYRVHVLSDGNYHINYRIGTEWSTAKLAFQTVVGETINSLDTIGFSNTGGWQDWETQTSGPVYLEEGYYNIRLYVVQGEHNLNWFQLEKTTSVNDIKEEKVSIYPNPASERVNIRIPNTLYELIKIKVYNLKGNLVKQLSGTGNEFTIKTSGLNSGVYFLHIQGQSFNITQKLIIE